MKFLNLKNNIKLILLNIIITSSSLSFQSYADEVVNINNYTTNQNYKSEIKKNLNKINELVKEASIKEINIYNSKYLTLFNDLKKNGCTININTPIPRKYQNILLADNKKDFLFLLSHEISHCILGKDLFENNIKWSYNLNPDIIKYLNDIIEINDIKAIKNSKPNEKIILYKVIYHEIFADVFASIYLNSINLISKDDINDIMVKREQNYNKDNNTAYLSFLALKDINNYLNKTKQTETNDFKELWEISLMISEKNFIEYILKKEQ